MIRLNNEDNPYYDPCHDREACIDPLCKEELVAQHAFDEGTKAQLRKVGLRLQAIYNIPDLGAYNKRMGEFIQDILKETE